MRIVKKLLDPSRPDAERLRRNEKMAMVHLMYAVTILDDLQTDLADRLGMIEDGQNLMADLSRGADRILDQLRVTIPENQRIGLENTSKDYIIRLTPASTPSETNVIMTKDEYRNLVDCARAKCSDCIMDDSECEGCELFQLLTSILPIDDYHSMSLCPYNLGEWKN